MGEKVYRVGDPWVSRRPTLINVSLVTDFSNSIKINDRVVIADCVRSNGRLNFQVINEVGKTGCVYYRINAMMSGLRIIRS